MIQSELNFDGETYEPALDHARLSRQYVAVFELMKHGAWWTLTDLSFKTGFPEQSISARIRDFRKQRFGSHTVNRRRIGGHGLFEYQLIINEGMF